MNTTLAILAVTIFATLLWVSIMSLKNDIRNILFREVEIRKRLDALEAKDVEE